MKVKKILNPYRLYYILSKLVEFKEFFKHSDEPYAKEVQPEPEIDEQGRTIHIMGWTQLHPTLNSFHSLVYDLKLPDYAHAFESKFYGDVVQETYEKYKLRNFGELCKQKLNYVEIFSILTSVIRSCRMDDGFLASFAESGNAYNIVLRCEELMKELEENELVNEIKIIKNSYI